ncbi:hypothetical protein [Criibacterium bergeronii]|uniref:hypothetical protein n=1 Tax=Criibacterium bergeronii TaxID=1871336 RepID=UPI0011C06EAF|nr:hypothetical protein [Criibacterium bergeronii]MBS6063708.1 hypothetical protein [Peptostreptococcaceae bacterium]
MSKLIEIVKQDSKEALGCTEPVAIAYCTNVCASYIDKSEIKKISVQLSKDFYKNAKSVKIPNTATSGIDLAVVIGGIIEKTNDGFKVFSKVDTQIIRKS